MLSHITRNTKADTHLNDVLWNECLVDPEKLDVVEMVDKIDIGFKLRFGPFGKRMQKNEQRFKGMFHMRITHYVKKLGVRVLYAPPPLTPISPPVQII